LSVNAGAFFTPTGEGREELRDSVHAVIDALHHIQPGPRTPLSPHELRALVKAIEVCPDEGVPFDEVANTFGEVIWANGVVPTDPACVAHLHPPTLLASVATDVAVSATNQSMDSWDQAPVATEVELHLCAFLAEKLGFSASGSGVMTSGGTASNVLGLTLARARAARAIGCDVGAEGLPREAKTWRILSSNQAHFSVQRAAAQLGLGRSAVVSVPTHVDGTMDLAALDAVLREVNEAGLVTIAIVGTAGTTDLGAIDPLRGIAARAEAVGAWFHVDAAVAGSFVMSTTLASRLDGIELADSVTIDFHKLWWQPMNASALMVRDVACFDLLRVISKYLDRGDELDGMVNLVGRSLDTSRRFDAAKVVASLRSLGARQFERLLDRVVGLAAFAARELSARPGWRVIAPPSAAMVVFTETSATADELRQVQQRLLTRGEMVLGRTEIKGEPCLKFTFMNPLVSDDDVRRLIDVVDAELMAVRGDR
jgi:L-2,4-diaminobutyrate decarboxylase